ncbi:hypothetical protein Glove_249g15 [Diversispora epigaea]|uniref:Uncharacterized protein n=1 Tax=Diversispora epigaea TaxID=1348612 RepID=A0A397IFR3_9GLOM|nr:hypothetical protein Glove_249g15 [Diversispora epigaea]
MVNDKYAQAKLYLDTLNKWHERWTSMYLKDYFFADMSSIQRKESINKLLKTSSKSMLIEFLATFEQALDVCEEAEQISILVLISENITLESKTVKMEELKFAKEGTITRSLKMGSHTSKLLPRSPLVTCSARKYKKYNR